MYVNETAVDLARLKFARKGIHIDPIFMSDIVGEYLAALKLLGADDAHYARDERNVMTTHGDDDSSDGGSDAL